MNSPSASASASASASVSNTALEQSKDEYYTALKKAQVSSFKLDGRKIVATFPIFAKFCALKRKFRKSKHATRILKHLLPKLLDEVYSSSEGFLPDDFAERMRYVVENEWSIPFTLLENGEVVLPSKGVCRIPYKVEFENEFYELHFQLRTYDDIMSIVGQWVREEVYSGDCGLSIQELLYNQAWRESCGACCSSQCAEIAGITQETIFKLNGFEPELFPTDSCVLCLEQGEQFALFKCGHQFVCRGCITKGSPALLKSCPLCREQQGGMSDYCKEVAKARLSEADIRKLFYTGKLKHNLHLFDLEAIEDDRVSRLNFFTAYRLNLQFNPFCRESFVDSSEGGVSLLIGGSPVLDSKMSDFHCYRYLDDDDEDDDDEDDDDDDDDEPEVGGGGGGGGGGSVPTPEEVDAAAASADRELDRAVEDYAEANYAEAMAAAAAAAAPTSGAAAAADQTLEAAAADAALAEAKAALAESKQRRGVAYKHFSTNREAYSQANRDVQQHEAKVWDLTIAALLVGGAHEDDEDECDYYLRVESARREHETAIVIEAQIELHNSMPQYGSGYQDDHDY